MQPSEDERILAALAHASIIANIVNLAGMIATALIWTSQRDRSEYVRRHALQSLLYHGMVLLVLIFLTIFWGICLGLSLLPVAVRPDLYRSSPPNSFWIALVGLVLPVWFAILATLYGLYGAYQVYQGRPFRYPLAGRLAHRQLQVGAASPPTQPAVAVPAPELVVPAPSPEPIQAAPDSQPAPADEVAAPTNPPIPPSHQPPADDEQ